MKEQRATPKFWDGVALTPTNQALLAELDHLKDKIDDYHRRKPGRPDAAGYRRRPESSYYVAHKPHSCRNTDANVDVKVARNTGPCAA